MEGLRGVVVEVEDEVEVTDEEELVVEGDGRRCLETARGTALGACVEAARPAGGGIGLGVGVDEGGGEDIDREANCASSSSLLPASAQNLMYRSTILL